MGNPGSSDHISRRGWLPSALALLEEEHPFVIALVVGPPEHPRLGQRLLIAQPESDTPDVSGDLSDRATDLFPHVRSVAAARGADLVTIPIPAGPGTDDTLAAEVMFSTCGPPEMVWIFGAGHVGRALAPVLPPLGFRVTVCDDRAEYVTPQSFPDPFTRRVGDFADLAAECAVRPGSWAVLVTRGHEHDEQILRRLAPSPPPYVGMIGSQRRAGTVRRNLATEGIPSDFLESICTPIGLDIGADSPAEIAVAIAAELVAVRRGAHPRMAPSRSDVPPWADTSGLRDLWQRVLTVLDDGKPVVLATVVSRRGSAPRGVGAQMALFADGSITGTIGGGCGEEEVRSAARRMIAAGERPRLLTIDLTGDASGAANGICGGRYTVFLELLQ
ncbi:MAG TPA: XdhC/CoxI family protein [Acidobacteriota bacterium]|nr:XdhC/CoxI family protein [Acidobacteriota bacterium]